MSPQCFYNRRLGQAVESCFDIVTISGEHEQKSQKDDAIIEFDERNHLVCVGTRALTQHPECLDLAFVNRTLYFFNYYMNVQQY
jgi:hypothetical protein